MITILPITFSYYGLRLVIVAHSIKLKVITSVAISKKPYDVFKTS
ncbi:hypothetical protein [Mucilaginibacter mali]|nr:hypothetical protein [Mucilaginibacter mali]